MGVAVTETMVNAATCCIEPVCSNVDGVGTKFDCVVNADSATDVYDVAAAAETTVNAATCCMEPKCGNVDGAGNRFLAQKDECSRPQQHLELWLTMKNVARNQLQCVQKMCAQEAKPTHSTAPKLRLSAKRHNVLWRSAVRQCFAFGNSPQLSQRMPLMGFSPSRQQESHFC